MTWTKLGDEFVDGALDLTDAAFRTHVEALLYSNRRLLDLAIPKRELHRFAGAVDVELAVKELLERGWWEDHGPAWWIGCKWPEWQRDRSQVEARRVQLSLAQRRRRRHVLGDHSLCLPGRCPQSTVDATDDYRDDPGRDGYGYGKGFSTKESEVSGSWP
jgi:hypothetical protein